MPGQSSKSAKSARFLPRRPVRLVRVMTPTPARRYLISYDIPDDARRRAVFKALTGFGVRVQFSVFEALLANHELNALAQTLDRIIDAGSDQIFIAPIAERGQPSHPCLAVRRVPRVDYWLV